MTISCLWATGLIDVSDFRDGLADGPMGGRTDPLIEMRGRIQKERKEESRSKRKKERKKERMKEPVAQRQEMVIGTLALLWYF